MLDDIFPTINILAWLKAEGFTLAVDVVLLLIAYKVTTIFAAHIVHIALRTLGEGVRQKTESLFTHIFVRFARVGFFIIVALTVLPRFGFDIGPILAGAGITGLAIGFAAQLLVRDVISGMVLLAENRFRKGDMVAVGGVEGVIEDFDLRGVTLRSQTGERHFVPFGEIRVITRH